MPEGLRELKKSQTRQTIAESAARLFREHGYTTVTVDDVADAALVSKKTVFNYFPTKEDLVFYKAETRAGELRALVLDRQQGVSLFDAFRDLCFAQADDLTGMRARLSSGNGFFRLIDDNPALRRKLHEFNATLLEALASSIAQSSNADPDDVVPHVLASALISCRRALFQRLRAHINECSEDATIRRAHRRRVRHAVAQLQNGFSSYN